MADATSTINDNRQSDVCAPGADCDCSSAVDPAKHLSWRAVFAVTAAGAALYLILVKLLGA